MTGRALGHEYNPRSSTYNSTPRLAVDNDDFVQAPGYRLNICEAMDHPSSGSSTETEVALEDPDGPSSHGITTHYILAVILQRLV